MGLWRVWEAEMEQESYVRTYVRTHLCRWILLGVASGESGMVEDDGRAGAMVGQGGCDVHKLFNRADCAAHHQLAVSP